jgi:hypothetical protein
VLLFGRLTLGIVFALSGITKLANVHAFVASVGDFRLLPRRLVAPFAVGVVAAELASAAALLRGIGVEAAAVVVLVLLAIFTTALVRSLSRGRTVVCRCFGELSARSLSWTAVLRNGLLLALAAATVVSAWIDGDQPPPSGDVAAVLLLVLGSLAVLALVGEAGAAFTFEAPSESK